MCSKLWFQENPVELAKDFHAHLKKRFIVCERFFDVWNEVWVRVATEYDKQCPTLWNIFENLTSKSLEVRLFLQVNLQFNENEHRNDQ